VSYIGSTPTTQSFIAGTDSFNGTGSATNFTLSRFVNSVNDVQVVVNNVVQYPPNYSVSGNTLTISPAPSAGTNNVYVRYLSTTLQSITIPGGSSVVGNFGLSGNLQLLGSAQRITGDFSNATIANRVAFQGVSGATTDVGSIPPSAASAASFIAFNSTDSGNAGFAQLRIDGGDARFASSRTGTGTFLPMTFYTGGSERMRVDTSGNVLVGASTGNTSNLTVATADGAAPANGSGSNALRLRSTATAAVGAGPSILFEGQTGNSTAQYGFAAIQGFKASSGAGDFSGALAFYTQNSGGSAILSERARIDSSGRLLIGASSFTANTVAFSQGSLYVNESVFVGNSGGTAARSVRLDGFQDEIYVAWSNGNTDNNTIKYAYGGTAWVNSSDETLKDIIEPISDAANKVCTLRAVIGKFKNEEEGARHPFLIAQDVQAVLPEAVYVNKSRVEGEPDTLGVGYTDTIPLLVAAIKEQQAMIEELKAKVAALEAQ
jgi:hypothetical protein